MSRTPRQADGDLLTVLTATDSTRYKAPRGGTPVAGVTVHLWRLPGTWSVWSAGPEPGTWWINALDQVALDLVEVLTVNPSRGHPVVRRVWKNAIAVRSRDILPWGAR